MNTLVNKAIETYKNAEIDRIKNTHNRAQIRVKECFGDYANNNLIETEKPCHFRIKDTQWDLVYGFCDGFTIWHKDYPKNSDDKKDPNYKNVGKYNAWQIIDMKTLGESLDSVSKTWGLV